MKRGIVILAHGSRAEVGEANRQLLKVVEMFRERTGNEHVKPAYMNVKSKGPGLSEAVAGLKGEHCEEIVVAPWFLTRGLHIQKDIPEMIEELRNRYPQVRIVMAEPLGPDSRLVDILLDRIREVG
jgi:sirohydrochlorin ferrochelatase